jgi:hypothetical protein
VNINRMIDQYRLGAEIQYENENTPLPVHLIATNTDDNTVAETWLTFESLRAHLSKLCLGSEAVVDGWMKELEDHGYTAFGAPQPEPVKRAATNRAIFKAEQLIPFGFSFSELRPWRV